MLVKLLAVILLAVYALSIGNYVFADREQDDVLQLKREGKILPLETILKKVNVLQAGKVLEVELEQEHGRYIYEIEILTDDGAVWEFKYDAQSAILLESELEH